eukprot:gene34480-44554_t
MRWRIRRAISVWMIIFSAVLNFRGDSFQNSAAFVPPTLPLSPFPEVTGEELREYAMEVVNILSEDELLAIFVSESTAGFTGGLASRVVASLIGDKKRDGGFLKGTTTGTYFGVRAAAKSASLLLGFSPPAATLIADIAGSVVAESTKVIGRKSVEDRDAARNEWMGSDSTVDEPTGWGTTMEPPAVNISIATTQQQPASSSLTISFAEVIQDVTKWVAYDLLLPADITDQVPFLVALQYGALSGLAGNAVFELLKANAAEEEEEEEEAAHIHHQDDDDDNMVYTTLTENNNNTKKKDKFQRVFRSFRKISVRFLRAGLEGGALFASYEGTVNFFDNSNKSLPPEVQAFFTTKFSDIVDDLKRLVSPS